MSWQSSSGPTSTIVPSCRLNAAFIRHADVMVPRSCAAPEDETSWRAWPLPYIDATTRTKCVRQQKREEATPQSTRWARNNLAWQQRGGGGLRDVEQGEEEVMTRKKRVGSAPPPCYLLLGAIDLLQETEVREGETGVQHGRKHTRRT